MRKTTILLREDLYQALKERAGPKGISKLINEILAEHFAKGRSMFGAMRPTDLSDLRDHRDRI
ncbi:hypothetical protein J7L65_00070 [Candidatus Bathyarchaeota archaeon]|nr:hypothetical protein [Candidatus Bathyarchaeota archaeon]